MKIFIRTSWSDYQEFSIAELQDRINHYYATFYVIDEITEDCIYVTQMEEE